MGIPNSGPGGAYEGEAVAGTILDGNYSDTSDEARLISPQFTVPTAEENPRLRYQQWYSFGASDFGHLQIRVVGEKWEDVPNEVIFSRGTAWSRASLDLRSYAGQEIQVSFQFISIDTNLTQDSGSGWYVDSVQLETGPMTLNNPEGFETGFGDWSVEGGVWQMGIPTSGPTGVFEGEAVAGTILNGNYPNGTKSRLVSPEFRVPSAFTAPQISFREWQAMRSGDSPMVQVRVSGGDWSNLSDLSGSNSGSWERRTWDITPYASQNIQFGFLLSANNSGTDAGWYLDQFSLETLDPIVLEFGESFNGSFPTAGSRVLFALEVPSGGHFLLNLDDLDNTGLNEVYLRRAAVATAGNYDYKFSAQSADQSIFIPNAGAGTWFILAIGADIPEGGSDYSIEVEFSEGIVLQSIAPKRVSNTSVALFSIKGAGFDGTTKAELQRNGTVERNADVVVVSNSELSVFFDTIGLVPGQYDLLIRQGENSRSMPIEVYEGGKPNLEARLIVPDRVGRHALATIIVEYANTGDAPMPAPLLVVRGSDNALLTLDSSLAAKGLWTKTKPLGFNNSVQFLGSGDVPGLLQPGERKQVSTTYVGLLQPWKFSDGEVEFDLGVITSEEDAAVDWNSLQNELRSPNFEAESWGVLWESFVEAVGLTWGDYVTMLAENALYLARLGIDTTDVRELLEFELIQAEGLGLPPILSESTDAFVPQPGLALVFRRSFLPHLSQRRSKSALGYGWSHNWAYSLQVDGDGTVFISAPRKNLRVFQPDSRGGYFSQNGDLGKLRKLDSGRFTILEPEGLSMEFNASGQLLWIKDSNGNQISTTYENTQLVRLEHSSGGTLQFVYENGLLRKLTDSFGKIVTYDYSDGIHLSTVTTSAGLPIYYTYITLGDSLALHSLSKVEGLDGRLQEFSYDETGRIIGIRENAASEQLRLTYDQPGRVTIEDSLGFRSYAYFNHRGRIAKMEDAATRTIQLGYDHQFNLANFTAPNGSTTRIGYDENGNPTATLDPLGNETRMAFAENGQLSTVRDARDNNTRYEYDDSGNPISIEYADGNIERFSYDSKGLVNEFTNRRGQTIRFRYDEFGRVVQKITPESRNYDYIWDSRGNLTRIVDSELGTTSMTYNERDLLSRIDYPDGTWHRLEHDTANRRRLLELSNGAIEQYDYDKFGRLKRLSEGTGQLIVEYEYESDGQVIMERRGNDTSTIFDYTASGEIQSVVHKGPAESVISRIDYDYDRNGNRASETSSDGTAISEYDALGRVVKVTAPDASETSYEYDEVGNRTRVVGNFEAKVYQPNEVNRYVSIAEDILEYDEDGNLVARTDSAGTTRFSFDSESRLTSIRTPADRVTEICYDSLGRVGSVKTSEGTNIFRYDPKIIHRVIESLNITPSRSDLITYTHGVGGNPVSRTTNNRERIHIHRDAQKIAEETGANGIPLPRTDNSLGGGNSPSVEASASVYPVGTKLGLLSYGVKNPYGISPYDPNEKSFISHAEGLRFSSISKFDTDDWLQRTFPADPFTNLPGSNLFSGAGVLFSLANGKAGYENPLVKRLGRIVSIGDLVTSGLEYGWGSRRNTYEGVKFLTVGSAMFLLERFRIVNPAQAGAVAFALGTTYDKLTYGLGVAFYNGWRFIEWFGRTVPLSEIGTFFSGIASAFDPNEIIGPGGVGERNYIKTQGPYSYRVNFENDREATAPAQVVEIRNPIPAQLDLSSLEFISVGFGDFVLPIAGRSQRLEDVQLVTIDGIEVQVNIELSVDYASREVRARFSSIMPDTLLPPPVEIGFLPPEDDTGRGMGHIAYVVNPESILNTGTEIRNVGFVTFDRLAGGPTFRTDLSDQHDPDSPSDPNRQALVTIDADGPTSSISALPSDFSGPNFTVAWSGDDIGSGIASYDIYTQSSGEDWALWLANTVELSAVWQGEFNKAYRFYSAARDGVGFREAPPGSDTPASRWFEVSAGNDGTYSIGDFVITVEDQDSPMINGIHHEATLDPGKIHRWKFQAKVGNEIRLWAENIDPSSGLKLWLGVVAPDGTFIELNGTSIDALPPFIADQEGDYTVLVADIDSDGTGPDRNDDSGPYRIQLRKLEPDLIVPDSLIVNELETLSAEIFSHDPDNFDKALEFKIISAPEGVSLQSVGNTNAVVSWTPKEDQGPGVYEIVANVTDVVDGVAWVDEQRFSVTVQEVNAPPQFESVDTLMIDELQPLNLTLAVRDDDSPKNDLSFTLVQAPDGMVIDPGSGVISWISTEIQGPGNFEVIAQVTDLNPGAVNAEQLSSNITFNAIVEEVNQAPTFPSIEQQTVTENTELRVVSTASDSDLPKNELIYSIVNPSSGATITPTTGVLTWIPSEEMGGTEMEITIQATDQGGLSATQAFQVTVEDENSPPALILPNDPISFEELTPGTIQVTATDTDIPSDTLTYSLTSEPAGMTIGSQTGLIEWTPGTSHGGSSVSFSVTVADGGKPSMSDTKTLTIAVGDAPAPPILVLPNNTTVDELLPYLETVSVTNASELGATISFALVEAPNGAAIDSATGTISWTPSEAQGPATHSFTIKASGESELIGSFIVQVNEVNIAPKLSEIEPQSVDELSSLKIELIADDSDEPANTLSYNLVESPEGATIDSTTGLVSWTPSEAQGPEEHKFVVEVSDNQIPSLSSQTSFTVAVNEVNTAPVPAPIADFSNLAGVPLVLPLTAEDEDEPVNSLTFTLDEAPPEMTILSDDNTLRWTPGDQDIGTSTTITFRVTDDGDPVLSTTGRFQITVTGPAPPDVIPLLTLPDNAVVDELSPFQVIVGITNESSLGENISYEFVDAPSGAVIDPDTGAIAWTPSEAQGPGTHSFTVNASGESELSGSFDVQVNEVNTAPDFAAVSNFSHPANEPLTLQITATDSDDPPNALSFSLEDGPAGMTIDASEGTLFWIPGDADFGTSPNISVRVMDDGEPELTDTKSFQVSVTEPFNEQDYPDPSVPLAGTFSGRLGPQGTTFLVTNDLVIPQGEILTIDPGVVIQFRDTNDGLIVEGTLIARGTAEKPIVFTSDNSSKGPGQWQSINLSQGNPKQPSILRNCVIEYGGASGGQNILVESANPIIEACVIRGSVGDGLNLRSSNARISGVRFEQNKGFAAAMDTASFPAISGSIAESNGSNSIAISGGSIDTSGVWQFPGIPYTITDDVIVGNESSLTIAPGNVIQFQDTNDALIVNGVLHAIGQSDRTIIFTSDTTSKGPGQWEALIFNKKESTEPSVLNHCVIEHGGASGSGMVESFTSALHIQNSTIKSSVGLGIYLSNADARIESCQFIGNASYAVSMNPLSFPFMRSNVAVGNGGNSTEIRGGIVIQSGTWLESGIPYTITDDVEVQPDTALKIEPGTTVEFRDTNDGLFVLGSLIADASKGQPIVFTSDNSSKGPGQWQGINLSQGNPKQPSILRNCVIEYGGASGGQNILVESANPIIEACVIRGSVGDGLNLRSSNARISGVRFEQNKGFAAAMDTASFPAISGSIAESNGSNSIAISGGSIDTSGVWQFPGIPYTITDDVIVGNESSLTIAPGNVIQFQDTNDALIVNGVLHAIGQSDRTIIFTSDTTSKGPGQWEALIFNKKESTVPSILNHCVIEYGGASGSGMVESFTSALQIQNSTIQSSVGVGIYLQNSSPKLNAIRVLGNRGAGIQASSGSQPMIRQSTIINNSGFGILNNDLSVIIDARENYWGDPTGPRDRADEDGLNLLNPNSNGQTVSEYVNWSSPLTSEFIPPDDGGNTEPQEVELQIVQFSNSEIQIIWSATEPVGQLETTPNLNAPELWHPVDLSPVLNGDHWFLILPAAETQSYFRLVPTQ